MDIIKVAIVALIALSPVGELLIAIPAGVGMGLPVFITAAIAAAANFLPVPALFFLFDRGTKYPRLHEWLLKRRNKRVKMWMDMYGVVGLFIVTPWIGVYAATVTCELLGMQRSKISIAIAVSLILYATVMALALEHFIY